MFSHIFDATDTTLWLLRLLDVTVKGTIILGTALLCVAVNVAVGFLAGLILEAVRVRWNRGRRGTA